MVQSYVLMATYPYLIRNYVLDSLTRGFTQSFPVIQSYPSIPLSRGELELCTGTWLFGCWCRRRVVRNSTSMLRPALFYSLKNFKAHCVLPVRWTSLKIGRSGFFSFEALFAIFAELHRHRICHQSDLGSFFHLFTNSSLVLSVWLSTVGSFFNVFLKVGGSQVWRCG